MATVPNPTLFLKTHSSAGVVEIENPERAVLDYAPRMESLDADHALEVWAAKWLLRIASGVVLVCSSLFALKGWLGV